MTEISLRFHNNIYAPGIATYGIDGKNGEKGLPGTCMFFAEYALPGELQDFAEKIVGRNLPIKSETITLERSYINGDIFVTPSGEVFRLEDIDNMISSIRNKGTVNTATVKCIGKIDKAASLFSGNLNRGSKLTISDPEATVSNNNAVLNIIKNNSNVNESADFISMQALSDLSENVTLDIKYDNMYNAFMLSSKQPIVINSDLYVNNKTQDNNLNSLEYSKIIGNTNPVTEFVSKMSEMEYELTVTIYPYTNPSNNTIYYGIIYAVTLDKDIEDSNIFIHLQHKDFLDFQLLRKDKKTYYFKRNLETPKKNDIINTYKNSDILNNIKVSVIHNFEVYLKCTKYNFNELSE